MPTLQIRLEIDGDEADAVRVVSSLLDAGSLQDEINDHEFDAGSLRVRSATVEFGAAMGTVTAALAALVAAHPPDDIPGQQRYFATEWPALTDALDSAIADLGEPERSALHDALERYYGDPLDRDND